MTSAGVIAGSRRRSADVVVPPSDLTYVGSSPSTIVANSVLNISPGISASTVEGDEMFAFIMHRSALTVPAGWSLVASQKCPQTGAAVDQWLSVLRKTYEAGDGSSATFSQASSGRMNGEVLSIRPGSGQVVTVLDQVVAQYSASANHPIQVVAATGDGQIALFGSSCLFANTTATAYSASSGNVTQASDPSANDLRMAAGFALLDTGQSPTSTHWGHSGTSHDGAEVAILLGGVDA